MPSNSKQRNIPLTVDEVRERLQIFGLSLVSEHPNGSVTTKTTVDVVCAAGHRLTRVYGNLRKRGCPECSAPFGERVLYALLRYYAVGVDDWFAKAVVGMDPLNLKRRFVFDAASDSRQIAIENHSEYHVTTKGDNPFSKKTPLEERIRRDVIKEARETEGIHTEGPMKGWRVGVVWFEGPRLTKSGLNYLPQVIEEFKATAKSVGLALRKDGVEIPIQTLYMELARTATSGTPSSFTLTGPWRGGANEATWQHECGGRFSALVCQLRRIPAGKTGCPFCDREGRGGEWLSFLDRLREHGYEYVGENRMEIRTQSKSVPLKCVHHPGAKMKEMTRSQLYQWLRGEEKITKAPLPPCFDCAKHRSSVVALKDKERRKDERLKLEDELRQYHHTMVTHNPSSVRRSDTGKTHNTKNLIKCLKCGHQRECYVSQTLAKARKKGVINCPKCCPGKKGPRPKLQRMLLSV